MMDKLLFHREHRHQRAQWDESAVREAPLERVDLQNLLLIVAYGRIQY